MEKVEEKGEEMEEAKAVVMEARRRWGRWRRRWRRRW